MYGDAHDRPKRDPFDEVFDALAAATRYDLALGIIPLAFALALASARLLDVPTGRTLIVAAVVCAFVVVDACYLHPPPGAGRRRDGKTRR